MPVRSFAGFRRLLAAVVYAIEHFQLHFVAQPEMVKEDHRQIRGTLKVLPTMASHVSSRYHVIFRQ